LAKTAERERSTTVRRPRINWWVPIGLILLALIPLISGSLRLVELAGGPEIMPDNPRADASPLPIAVHIVCALIYTSVGAFQFVPALRRYRWHRYVGRALVPLGLFAALSALWMALFYAHPEGTDELLVGFRLVFGSAMAAFIVLGFLAIRRRQLPAHRAWMTRAYAVGLGAGTQAVVLGFAPLLGPPTETTTALCHAAGWVINLGVAEWVIRRRPRG
jgi:hypothetical protein